MYNDDDDISPCTISQNVFGVHKAIEQFIFLKLRKIIIGIKINPASPLRTNLGVNISMLNILTLLLKQQDKLHK